MATRIISQLLDDLDGGDADETITFAMDNVAYTIDLSSKNAVKFRELMATYQEAATRVGRAAHGSNAQLRPTTKASFNPAKREDNNRIRVWAADNGYELSERGRIPMHVVEAYESKTPAPGFKQASLVEQEVAAVPRKRAAKKATAAAFSGASS